MCQPILFFTSWRIYSLTRLALLPSFLDDLSAQKVITKPRLSINHVSPCSVPSNHSAGGWFAPLTIFKIPPTYSLLSNNSISDFFLSRLSWRTTKPISQWFWNQKVSAGGSHPPQQICCKWGNIFCLFSFAPSKTAQVQIRIRTEVMPLGRKIRSPLWLIPFW